LNFQEVDIHRRSPEGTSKLRAGRTKTQNSPDPRYLSIRNPARKPQITWIVDISCIEQGLSRSRFSINWIDYGIARAIGLDTNFIVSRSVFVYNVHAPGVILSAYPLPLSRNPTQTELEMSMTPVEEHAATSGVEGDSEELGQKIGK